MAFLPNPELAEKLDIEIATYERSNLTALQPPIFMPATFFNNCEFVHIQSVANFWQDKADVHFAQSTIDLVTSAHGYGDYLSFVVAGTGHTIRIYFALSNANVAHSLLSATYPGISFHPDTVTNLGATLTPHFAYMGMLSGIPTAKVNLQNPSSIENTPFVLERLIRAMRDTAWAYAVQVYPRPASEVANDRQQLLERVTTIASLARQQLQRSTQATNTRTNRQTESIAETMSGEFVNRRAEYAVKLLERELERRQMELATGRWQAAVYFGAASAPALQRLASLLVGVFSGPDSYPEPIRAHLCKRDTHSSATQFHTYLSSVEVATLMQLPREEAPGYTITDHVRFDVDFQPPAGTRVTIGTIQWEGISSGKEFQLLLPDLAKHGVVCGVTGSGKTTTLLGLLHHVWQAATPFLVIEPAKREYRALLGRVESYSAKGPLPNLRLYTLGNDLIAPFRLNPFEFETSDLPGSGELISHIDFLKAVFNAAFILYAPMPYILETALHEIYEDKGWNLATGENVRLPTESWKLRHQFPIFPTLTDLYHKVESVTVRLGYEERIEQNVIAGLKARLGALRLGAKGLMLDTPHSMPMYELLSNPTVLEMETIGNDDEKTFLIGLVLARIYEYRRLQAAEGKLPIGLQHILVIEEAHRLLKHVNTEVDTESANARAQAVETFVNMLSEIRHYGQGVLVAEQIPSKLTPDVIKNTNLKIVHRLLAKDDRELLGATMNMSPMQVTYLATLRPGEAVVYAEREDHPLLLRIDNAKLQMRLHQPLDSQLTAVTPTYIALDLYSTAPDFATYGLRRARFQAPDPLIYQTVLRYLDLPLTQRRWALLMARTIFLRDALPAVLEIIRKYISVNPGQLSTAHYREAFMMWLVFGTGQALQTRGAEQGWSYPTIDAMRVALTNGLIKLAQTSDIKLAAGDLDRFALLYEAQTKRDFGPYPGCHHCRAVCLYHSEVRRLVAPTDRNEIRAIFNDITLTTVQQKYDQVTIRLRTLVGQWLDGMSADLDDIGYCSGLMIASSWGLDEFEQIEFANNLLKHFGR